MSYSIETLSWNGPERFAFFMIVIVCHHFLNQKAPQCKQPAAYLRKIYQQGRTDYMGFLLFF